MICCFCGEELEYTGFDGNTLIWGNNPDNVCSIPGARCCNSCYLSIVLPVRAYTMECINDVIRKKKKTYSLSTIRRKAYAINYKVEKGFIHNFVDNVDYNDDGEREIGYMVLNLENGNYIPECYDETFDHLWDLDDVVNFLEEEYESRGLKW